MSYIHRFLILTGVAASFVGCTTAPTNSTNAVTEPITVGPTTEELTNLSAQGQLVNSDYGFIIDVGSTHADNITVETITPFEGVTDTYVYCYVTSDVSAESSNCPAGSVETFRINVYTTEQYQPIQEGPGAGSLITETAGYVYELAHPNGLLPDDVPANEDFYNDVVASFHFAG